MRGVGFERGLVSVEGYRGGGKGGGGCSGAGFEVKVRRRDISW